MKKWLAVMLIVLGALAFSSSVRAQSAPATLYYSESCSHCQNVLRTIQEKGYETSLTLTKKEINGEPARQEFITTLNGCGVDSQTAIVPMLYTGGKCFSGETDVLGTLTALAGDGAVAGTAIATTTPLPVVSPGVPHEEARRNTLLFILAMSLLMGGLVAVGYWKQKSSGKTPEMAWAALLLLTIAGLNAMVLGNPLHAAAFCPVCTVAVGAGLGVAKELGIDDLITSIWIGGLMVSMTMWLINWLDKKKIRFLFRKPLVVLIMYGLVIIPFINSKTIGANGNSLWGMDKILLGMILGTVAFIGGYILNSIVMKSHNDKVYFPFQKVVFPIAMMIIFSLVFYFIVY